MIPLFSRTWAEILKGTLTVKERKQAITRRKPQSMRRFVVFNRWDRIWGNLYAMEENSEKVVKYSG